MRHRNFTKRISGTNNIIAPHGSGSRDCFTAICRPGTVNRNNAFHFVAFHIVSTNQKNSPDMILTSIRNMNGTITFTSWLSEFGIHGKRQPFIGFLFKLSKRSHRLIIRKTCDHTVRSLIIKLHKMEMRIDLRRLEIRDVIVKPFAGQNPIHAIINIGAEY